VARFPGKVALAEGDFDLVIEGVLGADMGALGIRVGTNFGAEALESGQNALWGSQDGNRVRGKACAGSVTCFELATEDGLSGVTERSRARDYVPLLPTAQI
jgi:hypothetical protein